MPALARKQRRRAGGVGRVCCPTSGLNVTYGIDANQFAVNGPLNPDGIQARNLGYSASVTVNLPVWDWLATEHKVKQSEIRRDAAQVALTDTQRRMIAQLDEAYSEAAGGARSTGFAGPERGNRRREPAPDQAALHGGEATVLEVVDAQTAYVSCGKCARRRPRAL